MEKEENQNNTDINQKTEQEISGPEKNLNAENKEEKEKETKKENTKTTPEEKIAELEDKVVRTFAEMENQRRR